MSDIQVPFMPISNFDVDVVSKSFIEAASDDDEKSKENLMPSVEDSSKFVLPPEITLILVGMGMEKYIERFRKHNVLLDTFLQLNDSDLQEIGIKDPKDREVIIKSLSIHRKTENQCVIPENHIQDLKIAKNVSQQLLLLQNYCAYVELQLKKHKLTDYRIENDKSACTYLKAFTETALVQSKILCDKIYSQEDYNSLIDKVLKIDNLVLSNALKKSLPKRKVPWKLYKTVYKTVIVVGFVSLVVFHWKLLYKKMSSWMKMMPSFLTVTRMPYLQV